MGPIWSFRPKTWVGPRAAHPYQNMNVTGLLYNESIVIRQWLGVGHYSIHYSDVIITGGSIVCLTVCSGADQRKHQSSASLSWGESTGHQGIPSQRASNVNNWDTGDLRRHRAHYDATVIMNQTKQNETLSILMAQYKTDWAIDMSFQACFQYHLRNVVPR